MGLLRKSVLQMVDGKEGASEDAGCNADRQGEIERV